jgi:3-oxoacyl-[acyl-carrier protein] reductase
VSAPEPPSRADADAPRDAGPEVVLVTGARTGIGRHLAEHFVRRGAAVVGCSRTAPDWALAGYTHHLADVTVEADVRRVMAAIRDAHGRLDVVVNNAGAASMNHLLLTPVETAARIMDVNFRGTFLVSREGAKLMRKRKYGRIVNFGTVAVPLRLAGEAVYAASKSAVVTFTQVMAREVGELGITCNVVAPSPIETDLIRGVPKAKIQQIIDNLAVKRLGRFEDVANVVDFFASPASGYVTGQVIYLGGVS